MITAWEALPVLLLLGLVAVLAFGSVGRTEAMVIIVGFVPLAVYAASLWRRVAHRRSWLVVELAALPERRFHSVVMELLHEFGYREIHEVEGDSGQWADFRCLDREDRSVIVRCQRPRLGYQVRSRDMKRFLRVASSHPKPDRKVFVTTANFTLRAWQLARQQHVRAIRGSVLARLIDDLRTHRETGQSMPIRDRFEL